MKICDWTRYYNEFATLSFADFLEALCRVSIVKTWPSDTVLHLPTEEIRDIFDRVETYNGDPKKAGLFERPAPYHDWSSHNVASRVKKLLLALYRRLAANLSHNAPLQSRCLRPGIARVTTQLGLEGDEFMTQLPEVAS
mmetsp:Transcript_5559/g.16815  ORF Transcript_5559/g.16815 Transcript_5559/m.16815 type:complete len:139 (-) Transcript_5559:551-967(-)